MIAAPAVDADAAADPDFEAFADAAVLLEPGAGVMLAVPALLDALCTDVCEAAADEADVACASLSAPAVIVIVALPTSVPSYEVVLDPGKLASLPPAVSLQTAVLEARSQSIVAVKSVFGSDMSTL